MCLTLNPCAPGGWGQPPPAPAAASAPSRAQPHPSPGTGSSGRGAGRSGALHPERASPGKAFSSPRQSPQPALAPSCPQGQRCGHAAGAQRLLHRAALGGMHSALGRGEEPEHTTQEEWVCTTGIGTWSDFRQERGDHDWHQRCGGDRRQRTPGRLSLLSSGCYGSGRNYLLLKALLLFLHVLHLRLQVPDLSDVRRRLREGKSAGAGAEPRAGSRGRPPRGARCQRLARARASHHRPSEPLRRWTEGA